MFLYFCLYAVERWIGGSGGCERDFFLGGKACREELEGDVESEELSDVSDEGGDDDKQSRKRASTKFLI